MTLDELLLEWSYRSDKGYPDMDNPSDISLLTEILEQLDLPTDDIIKKISYANKDGEPGITGLEPGLDGEEELEEPEIPPTPEEEEKEEEEEILGETTEYDELIKTIFNGEIPKSKNTYNFSKSTFDVQVKEDDLEIWARLWAVKPKKKTGDKTETLGVGKGELSLYWLYNHSNSPTAGKLAEGRGDDAPDLWFNGQGNDGVEVKAYGKPNGVIDVGRFGKFRDNLKMLNTVFGIAGLAATFDGNVDDQKQKNALTWAGSDLKAAFEQAHTLSQVDLEQIADIWPIFNDIKANIDYLDSQLGGFNSAEEGAKKLVYKFIGDKLSRKPGWGGHLADMSFNGFIRFWHVDKNKFESYDDILGKATAGASQGAMKLHFNKIFG